ncbi:phosphatase domain-containing protein [Tautonia sociabilis]|uniref:Swiss Army Knife protein DSP-PTPase phosphatase domain-containing protein n=1 Tax=Tautonia sociabilis TaxID=2080755 RepID=A0A432MQ03_9BACT|nr:hypothetical protein [Tautonia sociabilis]RUL89156.1 hypothetical protein TsocGM_03300 [Tautonia sociabilis]
MRCFPSIALPLALALLAGPTEDEPSAVQDPRPISAPGIENLFRLGPNLLSGGQPEGDEAFRALADLGVRTIITVDGAAPDTEAARRYGMRYVHLPIGYDGVPREQAVALVKAVRSLPGPFYVHCHHGKHRGPSAAAVCAIATQGWDKDQARRWLEEAGTSPDYAGLFASVAAFEPPTVAELAAVPESALPERAEVPDLVAAMVDVDQRWERLKAVSAAGFRTPPDHPDLDPPHEALMLAEHYRELARLDEAKDRGAAFLRLLARAERDALALRDALRDPAALATAPAAFDRAGRDCKACHSRFRDQSPN